jgi:hypothetical protein
VEEEAAAFPRSPTFEDIADHGVIELSIRGGEGSDGDTATSTTTSSSRALKHLQSARILTKINERQEAEFQTEVLPNPFFVHKKKDQGAPL